MKIEHRVGKHDFELVVDVEEIINKIGDERNNYYEETYVNYGEIPEGYNGIVEEEYLTKEEYNKNIDEFIEEFKGILDEGVLVGLIESASKKKNGTFYKGRVVKEVWGKNSEFITEWHNTWIHSIVKVKAISDKTLEMSYGVKTNTPG